MKVEKITDKLKDLYGIDKDVAKVYWRASLYVDVLKDKLERAKKLQAKLMEEPMMKRDTNRIGRIGNAIAHCTMLLKEIQ